MRIGDRSRGGSISHCSVCVCASVRACDYFFKYMYIYLYRVQAVREVGREGARERGRERGSEEWTEGIDVHV